MSNILNKYKHKRNDHDSANRHNLMNVHQKSLPKIVTSDDNDNDSNDNNANNYNNDKKSLSSSNSSINIDNLTPTLQNKSLPLNIGKGQLSLDQFNDDDNNNDNGSRFINLKNASGTKNNDNDNSNNSSNDHLNYLNESDKLSQTSNQNNLINDNHSFVNKSNQDFNEFFNDAITGFAVASSRRNAEFHDLFPNIPEQDYLIEDYGCALQREILIQGRLYISENHVCFHANIFGWITSFALPFSEMVSIEKKMTALVIPNAIQISNLRAKYVFASFLSRDTTYDVILNIWKLSHPTVPISDFHHESARIQDNSLIDSDTSHSTTNSIKSDSSLSKYSYKKHSKKNDYQKSISTRDNITRQSNQQPSIHRPTSIDPQLFFNEIAMETTLPATPEKLYNLMFTSFFIKDFMTSQDLTG